MKDFEPDMVHVHFAVPNGLIAFLYRIIKRKPYVLTAHLGDIPGGSPEKTKKWFRYILPFTPPIWKSAAVAVAVSEYSKSLVEKVYPVPVRVIYNGVDYQRIKIDANDIVTHAVPQIVFAGRFVKQKNIPQIVNVLEQLRTLPWHCVLIGDGEQKEMIQALISDKGLTDRFEFPGWKTPDEVMAIFKCSDILFLPSLYEGLPVVAIQAMACGLALVASNAGGNAEIVREGVNGFSADYDDTARFCESLTMLINNKDLLLELRKNALALAAQYDIEKIGQQYEMLFTEIVDKPTLRGAK